MEKQVRMSSANRIQVFGIGDRIYVVKLSANPEVSFSVNNRHGTRSWRTAKPKTMAYEIGLQEAKARVQGTTVYGKVK